MNLSTADLERLTAVALGAAREAGDLVARSRPTEIGHKAAGASAASQIVTEVDHAAEALILQHLEPTLERFELVVLTEERDDDGRRLAADHFWCVDPLDGTLPFVEGQPGSAVSIALVRRDGMPLLGVVCDPVTGTVRHAIAGQGAFRDGGPWTPPARRGAVLTVFADRSLLADDDGEVEEGLGRVARASGLDRIQVRVGAGAVMNACGVFDHPPGCYVKLPTPDGGGSLWDFAATACIATELGVVVTDANGERLDLNRADGTSMGHRGICFASDDVLATRLRALATELAGG